MIFGNKEQILYGNRFNGTNGNGYQPIKREHTNEEWIHTLNTEQLARWIVKIVDCDYCPVKQTKCKNNVPCIAQIEKWLKQPHTPIS